ncbi:unnamed protein product [Musa acuminata subsp. malaccensis]|uniref:(wild Malaysian banana) hypothetical protein n=1 Tax=Musa acuminata subsp. malaccensis TaxID=214687 RepID=A0A804HZR1_MUSAM|nr:unnamed protein product [Musa acuminata subsp. malaccensis]
MAQGTLAGIPHVLVLGFRRTLLMDGPFTLDANVGLNEVEGFRCSSQKMHKGYGLQ